MKVTKVILAANNNAIYWQFWNPISKIYKENFGIKPVLIWFGTEQERIDNKISCEFGDVISQEPVAGQPIGWQSAWAIFWFMKFFPKDTFCTMGIDQVPLSKLLIESIPSQFKDDDYLMLADDAYLPSHWATGGTSPTSFHIVRGDVANKVYGFERTFSEEINKIVGSGVKPYYDEETRWGLDESYSSYKLREYRQQGGFVASRNAFKFICERRIECARVNETPYDEDKLKEGWYGDAHLCRPISDHQAYIDKLLSLIPK